MINVWANEYISIMKNHIESETGKSISKFVEILITAIGLSLSLVHRKAEDIKKEIFVSSCSESGLLSKGQDVGIIRHPPVSMRVNLALQGDASLDVTSNTIFKLENGIKFITLSTVNLGSRGESIVEAEASSKGIIEVSCGDTLNPLSPIAGLKEVIVLAILIEGSEEENIASYRQRVLEKISLPPQGSALPDFVAITKSTSDVTRVFVYGHNDTDDNEVHIYFLTDDLEDRIPSEEKINEIQSYLSSDEVCPIGAHPIVKACPVNPFQILINGMTPLSDEVKNSVANGIKNFLLDREPETVLKGSEKAEVTRTLLESVAVSFGAKSLSLRIFLEGVDLTESGHSLRFGTVAELKSISFDEVEWVL